MDIKELGLPRAVEQSIRFRGEIETVEDLIKAGPSDLLKIRGFGRSSMRYVNEGLARYFKYMR